jgi:NAD(P)-dependent dehydrogenase (short-subunit alcohol dehydrogenase family)
MPKTTSPLSSEELSALLAVRKAVSSSGRRLVRRVSSDAVLSAEVNSADWNSESFTDVEVVSHPTLGLLAVAADEASLASLITQLGLPGDPAAATEPGSGDLDGHIIAVTGAANGIGEAIARVLASRGANLVLADLADEQLALVAADIGAQSGVGVATVVGDVSATATNEAIVEAAVANFGGLDGFVANAGIATAGEIAELDPDSWNHCMAVNLFSAFSLTQATLRVLREQDLGGSLVYIASKNAFGPGHGFGAYSVSKAGMVQLARIVAIEGGEFGIRSNIVNPDSIFGGSKLWSPELRKQRANAHGVPEDQLESHYAKRNLLQSTITGSDVGESVVFLLSERSHRTTGCVITVDGGVSAAFPR